MPESTSPIKPDYGLCVIPFGVLKGQRFMDVNPYHLHRIREWCLASPDRVAKYGTLIHDIEAFLGL